MPGTPDLRQCLHKIGLSGQEGGSPSPGTNIFVKMKNMEKEKKDIESLRETRRVSERDETLVSAVWRVRVCEN